MTKGGLSELIGASFPIEPMPGRFWIDDHQPPGDIPDELAKRIAYRPWSDITMHDWTMIGCPAAITRVYIDPDAFRYYLPSLLIGGFSDLGYIAWPLECLLPAGQKRRTHGRWWEGFWVGFTEGQRDVVRTYLTAVRSMLREPRHLSEFHFIDEAQSIWGRE